MMNEPWGAWRPWSGRAWWLLWRLWQQHWCPGLRLQSLQRQSQGQHQAGPPGQGHENQVPEGDLSLLFAHQAIWDYWLLRSLTFSWSIPQEQGFKDYASAKQTCPGQRTRVKTFCHHWGLQETCQFGCQVRKEVATAIHGVTILAKLSVLWGSWGDKNSKPHTASYKVTGRCCGSVLVRLIPVLRSTGAVLASVPRKLVLMAGTDDCCTSARGCPGTLGNVARATSDAISKTYSHLTPDLWKEMLFTKSQYQDFSDHLVKIHTRVSVQRTQPPHSHQIVLYEKNIMNEARKTRKKSYTEGSAVRKWFLKSSIRN